MSTPNKPAFTPNDFYDDVVSVEVALEAVALMIEDLLDSYLHRDPAAVKSDEEMQALILNDYGQAHTKAYIANGYMHGALRDIRDILAKCSGRIEDNTQATAEVTDAEIALDNQLSEIELDAQEITATLFAVGEAIEHGDYAEGAYVPALHLMYRLMDSHKKSTIKAREIFNQLGGRSA